MTEDKISDRKIEDRILQLIYLAEVNLECCKSVYNFFRREEKTLSEIEYVTFINQDEPNYLVLSGNNHLFESISIIHSLLHQVNTKSRELSFQLYEERVLSKNCFDDKNKEFLFQIENLRKEFEKEKFSELRNKVISHKELKKIGDPISILLLIDYKLIEKLDQLIQKLKTETLEFFTNPTSNNYLMNNKRGLENILTKIGE